MAREKILIVDDEENILELIRYNLGKEGYQTECFTTGEEAVKKARADGGDLILLDLMLPGLDGLEVLKILKNDNRTQAIPVIIVSAKGEESDIVAGLELGADDYITKPFSLKILVARVRSVLRRKKGLAQVSEGVVRVHDLVIDPARHEV
ncbi:MAG: response regulator, partial [Proteobacteria bacterium]|nr:response regulator [Pseudomonadota bacterium]